MPSHVNLVYKELLLLPIHLLTSAAWAVLGCHHPKWRPPRKVGSDSVIRGPWALYLIPCSLTHLFTNSLHNHPVGLSYEHRDHAHLLVPVVLYSYIPIGLHAVHSRFFPSSTALGTSHLCFALWRSLHVYLPGLWRWLLAYSSKASDSLPHYILNSPPTQVNIHGSNPFLQGCLRGRTHPEGPALSLLPARQCDTTDDTLTGPRHIPPPPQAGILNETRSWRI